MWKGRINVVPYTVEFGDTFEPNVRYALERAFGRVMMLDSFPPGGSGAPQYSVSVWISDADVSPGALTFMSSSAAVHLEAEVATGTLVHDRRIEVEGIWESSPGAAGLDVGLGQNQVAYEATLQSACEGAMREALWRLIEELLLERARGSAP